MACIPPHVSEQAFPSILATPLVTSNGPVGALNLYARSAGAFDIGQQQLASLFAAQAATVASHAGVELTLQQIVARLQAVLQARDVIAQAQGALMNDNGRWRRPARQPMKHTPFCGSVRRPRAPHSSTMPNTSSMRPKAQSVPEPPVDHLHTARLDADLSHAELWLATSLIGPAKETMMVSVGWSDDAVSELLKQSQHHDRKHGAVATDIIVGAQPRRRERCQRLLVSMAAVAVRRRRGGPRPRTRRGVGGRRPTGCEA